MKKTKKIVYDWENQEKTLHTIQKTRVVNYKKVAAMVITVLAAIMFVAFIIMIALLNGGLI